MKHLWILLSACFSLSPIWAQQHPFQPLSNSLDSLVSHKTWAAEIPGFAIGVVLDDQVVFEKVYGKQSLTSGRQLTTHSDFHMASVSKPFVAVAILQLVEEGILNLDSTVVSYIPYFKMKDERYKRITLYHILTHSSGIPDVTDYEWDNPQSDDGAAERYVKGFSQKELDFAPGTSFNYSNAAFDILADVIAKSSGMTFEKYMDTFIFLPAGMKKSSFDLEDISLKRRTSPHVIDDSLVQVVSKIYPYNRIHAPSSTLHSNLEDMLQWAKLLLNKGRSNGQEIIKQTTWENMLQPRIKVNDEYTVCLSWFETKVGDRKIYFHSGGDTGYRTYVGFEPQDNIAVVLMGNNELFDGAEFGTSVFKSIFNIDSIRSPKKSIHFVLKDYILTEGINKVKEVFYQERAQHPNTYEFGTSSLVTLADWLYDRGYVAQAIDMLIFCTELEPNVSRWYESLGDVYAIQGNKAAAATWFMKALLIEPAKKEIEGKITNLGVY